MKKGVILVFLLVVGWVGTLQGVPALPDPLYPTQENFDLDRFMGKWHDVAVASTCLHTQHRRGEAAIGKLELEISGTADTIKVTRSVLRHGTCKEISWDYELTDTPGRFFYSIESMAVSQMQGWWADVDAYVVHTNYDEYAILIMSKRRSSGEKTTSLKLYSRTMEVRATVLDDFKRLVREQGMSDDAVVIKQNKGECVPGEQVAAPDTQRLRRSVVPSVLPAEEAGSGDEAPLFKGTESCNAETDAGPCFGMVQRYYYNSSSMSCQMFSYGGCLGNQNNFVTERDCLQSCRTEAACRLPMVAYPCTGQQPQVWAFDSTSGLCLAYKKGFCQGNGNKFYSEAECQEYCGVVRDVTDGEFLEAN